ncbi:MAG: hypothetical protein JKY31_06255 [Rhodobacteraceae bacterium]|nr:hypothetical protein [Paracoccaceae bacterium]
MGNPKDEKKKMDSCKKDLQGVVKKLSQKIRSERDEIQDLLDERATIEAKKEQTQEDKDRLKAINTRLEVLFKKIMTEATSSTKQIDLMLKKQLPSDKNDLKAWQKGFVGGAVDLFKNDPGLKIGNQLFFGADVQVIKKKITLKLTYKF